MKSNINEFLTVSCGDLMLARNCMADLSGARFQGRVSVIGPQVGSSLELLEQHSFGNPTGEAAARGLFVGAPLGAIIGSAVAVLFPSTAPMQFVGIGLAIGAVIGFATRWLDSRRGPTSSRRRSHHWIHLRCDGAAEELNRIYCILQSSSCQDLRVHLSPQDAAEPAASFKR